MMSVARGTRRAVRESRGCEHSARDGWDLRLAFLVSRLAACCLNWASSIPQQMPEVAAPCLQQTGDDPPGRLVFGVAPTAQNAFQSRLQFTPDPVDLWIGGPSSDKVFKYGSARLGLCLGLLGKVLQKLFDAVPNREMVNGLV